MQMEALEAPDTLGDSHHYTPETTTNCPMCLLEKIGIEGLETEAERLLHHGRFMYGSGSDSRCSLKLICVGNKELYSLVIVMHLHAHVFSMIAGYKRLASVSGIPHSDIALLTSSKDIINRYVMESSEADSLDVSNMGRLSMFG